MNQRIIVTALVTIVFLAAVGGFGAPFLCRGAGPACSDRWAQASGGALSAAGLLSALLARCAGAGQP